MTTTSSLSLSLFLLSAALLALPASAGISPEVLADEKQPPDPGDLSSTHPNTVPAFPVVQTAKQTCHLDLSDELFGGVGEACGRTLDRSRCCPVLAAWLFAAHARSALDVRPPPAATAATEDGPLMPDDNQKCVDSLQSSLARRDIHLPRPNATCDTVLCFCGIRLHQIGSLRCPAAFNVSGAARNATPTAAVRELERSCRNASYAGCTRCLQSLEKLKGHGSGGSGDRTTRIFGRDCQLMGLTWLLAKNRTAYIPTVSAVLRAVLYSVHPPSHDGDANYKCSLDQENMPLAVDSLRFRKLDDSSTSSCSAPVRFPLFSLPVLVLIPLLSGHVVLGGT